MLIQLIPALTIIQTDVYYAVNALLPVKAGMATLFSPLQKEA